MKLALQLGASALALVGLLTGPASHATNLSELPLKASVLAKPNVVFGMDDSGSMDWEVLLPTNSGLAYWNGSSSFDAGTRRPLTSNGSYVAYAYLFPVGTATGGAIYAYNNGYGQAAPPTNQFAWLRSASFNPLYYNSNTTYTPWAPAYVNSTYVASYPNATSSGATAHPAVSGAPTLNLASQWDSGNGSFSSNGYRFYVQPGMTLPIGTLVSSTANGSSGVPCANGGSNRTITAAQTVGNNSCWASIPYYPATFWNAENCSVNDTDCITAPDGSTKLKRYEIKSGTSRYPSGRTYAAELQNFANWFSYSRKRKLMLAASMGAALENVTGLRMAVMPFGSSPTLSMADADAASSASNRFSISGQFYTNAMTTNGTPTHATVKRIGDQFDTNTNIIQYACQRNSMFVVTDGFANANSETAPSYTAATYGGSAPYTTTATNSLADFALAYYTNRLRASDMVAGKVPAGSPTRVNPDSNTNLHVTTYAITLGTRGTLYPNAANPFATDIFATPPTWPTPVGDDPTMIDDLWHATVNGRGQMYLASDVEGTKQAIQNALNDILSQAGAQGGVAVSAVNLGSGDSQAYLGAYDPRGWSGDLTANPINVNTGDISNTPTWRAASLLAARPWSGRVIFTALAGSGVNFVASDSAVTAAVDPGNPGFSGAATVDYLRGNRDGEGGLFRPRTALMGAVVNGEPVLAREENIVYVASGEGMLHAFDTVSGAEQWAFVPPGQLASVGRSVQRGWVYQTLLDATPTYARLNNGQKLLVGGMGAAGRSYYALNVTSPRGLSADQARQQFRWSFPSAADTTNAGRMGYTVGRPVIARTAAEGDVVLVTSGYDNGQTISDGKGRLWVLNPTNGNVLRSFVTSAGSNAAESGLTHVSAFKEADGNVRYVYGGDLRGNIWRFDLSLEGTEIVAGLVATLRDSSNNEQPVTAIPELTMVDGKRVILVGTGRLLDISDFGSSRVQTFYAIADDPASTLTNARTGLVQQVYTPSGDGITNNPVNWATGRGWYVDLPAGQQANTEPVIAYGAVIFVTNVNGSSNCAQASYMYVLNIGTGSRMPPTSQFPLPFVGVLLSEGATASRAIALRTVGGRIIATCHFSDNTLCKKEPPVGATIKPAKNAWKEIRR